MIGKWAREAACASARRNCRYALGYLLGTDKEASRVGYWAVIDEGMLRPDRGAGVAWEPVAGNGERPAAIFAGNVSALATVDLEMQLVADANPLLKSAPTMHLILSHNPTETASISNAEVIAADIDVLNRLGLGDHQYLISVHRDVPHHVHSHIVVGKCHPDSLRVWESWRDRYRLPWALRETEIALQLDHDNGAAIVLKFEGHEIVRWAPASERATWHRERLEERLETRVRRYLEDHTRFDTPKSWARDRVGVAVAKYLSKAQERGTSWRDADVHVAAAELGARLESLSDDRVRVTVMERVPEEEVEEHRVALIRADASLQKRDALGDPIELYVPAQRAGATVELSIQELLGFNDNELRNDSVVQQIAFMRKLVSADESEQRFIDQLRKNPSLVSSELIAAGRDVFSRDGIASFVAARVTDPRIVAELCDLVETQDVNLAPSAAKNDSNQIRMLSGDTEHFSYTTKAQLALHNRVDEQLRELISKSDPNGDEDALQRALRRFEASHLITLDPEQRQLIGMLTKRWSVVDGMPGTGKTVAMEVARLYAEEAGRPIIGLTVTDGASRVLANATGIPSMNIALALTKERMGKRVIPKRAFVVIDESSQPSYGQLDELFAICRQRECSGISIGGSTQLGPIEAGFPHGAAMRVGKEVDAFTALTRVRRQRGKLAWLARDDETSDPGLIYKMDQAISSGDREVFADCVLELCRRGLTQPCADRDSTIASAVEYNLEHGSSGERLGLFADANITGNHINAELQGRLGLVGTGQRFNTAEHGEIELTKKSRIIFLKNARLGDVRVSNGDTGVVTELKCDAESGAWLARVHLDDSRVASFNPGEYKAWNLGWASTIYKTQGASFRSPAVVADKGADPRLLFTGLSRAVEDVRIFYPETVYPTPQDFAESIAERLRPHLDAQEIEKIEELTGGKDTIFAQRMRKAAADDGDPLHIRHEEYNAAQRAEYMKRAREVDQKYETLITQADPAERDQLHHALRSEKARLHKRFARISFPLWLSRERDGIEREVVREHQMRNYARYSHNLHQESHTIEEPTIRIDVDEPPSSGLKLV